MSASDDLEWLDALAGRDTRPSPAHREAMVLRAALRAGAAPATPVPTADLAREASLLARAARAGLIDAAPRRPRWPLPLAAGVLLMLGAAVLVQMLRLTPPTTVVRGDDDGVVHITATNPAELKRRILDELRAAGVDATGYEALNVHGIDADLPTPLPPQVGRVLATHDIPVPADGVLRIEIRSPE
ncbi:MAG TPA: hypothetical protein VFV88_02995 [Steroidobacteraceae bacterium]|jgi:hypothetical protein|nr:hypothetical protein [Steroidobacteraceae bacterium]